MSPWQRPLSAPPAWTAAPEQSYTYGRFNDASEEDFEIGETFCSLNAVERARLLPSSEVDRIASEGCGAWGLEFHITDPFFTQRQTFQGITNNQIKLYDGGGVVTRVMTAEDCKDCCLISNLPFVGGLYYRSTTPNRGVYFELTIEKMNGVIAIGTVCRPYPHFRLPGWHRLSAALHLDDMRKFYENPDGGQESGYGESIGRAPGVGDTLGCGYEFGSGGTLFFTFNGRRLVPDAFKGLYLADDRDAYAAIGLDGDNVFTVNFGGGSFKWAPANEPGWRLNEHVGKLSAPEDVEVYYDI